MPDWTYQPLRGAAAAVLGERRSRSAAVGLLANLGRLPGGAALVAAVGHSRPPAEAALTVAGVRCPAPVGIAVPPGTAGRLGRVLPALGAGLLEVRDRPPDDAGGAAVLLRLAAGRAPSALPTGVDMVVLEGAEDPAEVRRVEAVTGRPVLAGVAAEAVADRLPGVAREVAGAVVRGPGVAEVADGVKQARAALPAGAAVLADCPAVGDPAAALALLDAGADAVLLSAGLVEAGPGLPQRVTEAVLSRRHAASRDGASGDAAAPRPAWGRRALWALLLGAGMVAGGLGAVVVTAGPVLLPYDIGYLGTGRAGLVRVSPRLLDFLRHDRVTLAGTMVSLGVLYAGLGWGGMRAGWPWARHALLASGAIGFPTLLYFLRFGFFDPLHGLLTLVLLPLFLAAVAVRPDSPTWTVAPDGPERQRRRALAGQLILVVTAAGLLAGGIVISTVGLTAVFVPSDLDFLGTSAAAVREANPRLPAFVAHDRSGFGGALVSDAVAVLLLSAWGWRRGAAWVWWTLLLASVAGFGGAVGVHLLVGYTDVPHLAPVLVAAVLTGCGLALSRAYLCARA